MQPGAERFAERFERAATLRVRAPGRANLLGEHTDYQDGWALPFALSASLELHFAARADGHLQICSDAFGDTGPLPRPRTADEVGAAPPWTRYLLGAWLRLAQQGAPGGGCDLLIGGDLQPGGGRSSSAALTTGFIKGYALLTGEVLDSRELIQLVREVERGFAGVPCGALDPAAILYGRPDHLLHLDCRTLEARPIPFAPERFEILLIQSGQARALAAGGYRTREAEAGRAAAYFAALRPEYCALRDVSSDLVRRHATQMEPLAAARALHITTENERVSAALRALRAEDGAGLGRLLNESHDSLRDHYEVSTPQIERLIALLRETPGVLGARLMGGGFGGAVIALARRGIDEDVAHRLAARYDAETELRSAVEVVRPAAGLAFEFLT